MKKYRIGFDLGALLLFLAIMLPNFIWSAVPAPHDVLRGESATELLDTVAAVCQVLMVAALIFIVRPDREKLRPNALLGSSAACAALYYTGWGMYYLGWTSPPVILLLTLPPCLAFLLYAADRKNIPAMLPGIVFACCHLVYAVVNFMI